MESSTTHLVLTPDTPIDLQTHTIYSDGKWKPEQLIDHAKSEGFGLIAITDHDRADTVETLQKLAIQKQMPVLIAVEMTTSWKGELTGEMTDVLCYGFDPQKGALNALGLSVTQRQRENTQAVYDAIAQEGFTFSEEDLQIVLDTPSAGQPHTFVAMMKKYEYGNAERSAGKILLGAGLQFITSEIAAVVEAGHHDGGVCLIAHPGRTDGFPTFDAAMFDELRQQVPIDGFEVYYPAHTPEQIAVYEAYAQKHDLLISSGSDSHNSDKPPIKYHAELSRKLLERLGIAVR